MEFWNLSSIMLSLSTGSNSERKLSFFKFLFNHILMSTLANLGGRISKAQLDFGFHSWCFILTDRNVVLEYLANHIFVYLRPDHDFRLVAKRCDEVCHSIHYIFCLKNFFWQDYCFLMENSPPLFCLEGPHTGGWCSVLGNLYLGFLVLVLACLADIWTGGGHIGTHLRTPVLFHLRVNVDPWTLLKPNRWPVEICFRCIIYL